MCACLSNLVLPATATAVSVANFASPQKSRCLIQIQKAVQSDVSPKTQSNGTIANWCSAQKQQHFHKTINPNTDCFVCLVVEKTRQNFTHNGTLSALLSTCCRMASTERTSVDTHCVFTKGRVWEHAAISQVDNESPNWTTSGSFCHVGGRALFLT